MRTALIILCAATTLLVSGCTIISYGMFGCDPEEALLLLDEVNAEREADLSDMALLDREMLKEREDKDFISDR